MSTLDALLAAHPSVDPDPLAQFRQTFEEDFGPIAGGDFVLDAGLPTWTSTLHDRPVAIRGQTAPSGVREYVLNGNRITLPSDFFTRDLASRQALLVDALRRYA